MSNEFIGDPDIFAIEFCLTSGPPLVFGHCAVWIEGRYFGAIQEEMPLGHSMYQLGRALERDVLPNAAELATWSAAKLYNRFVIKRDGCTFCMGESADDFLVFCFCTEDSFVFVWELLDIIHNAHVDYPKGPQKAIVAKPVFEEVSAKYIAIIKQAFAE